MAAQSKRIGHENTSGEGRRGAANCPEEAAIRLAIRHRELDRVTEWSTREAEPKRSTRDQERP
jgi:hypothetical protein